MDVQKVLAWAGGLAGGLAGWAVLEVELLHVFEHVIDCLCEKDVFKKCWHGQFLRSSFCMFLIT